LREKPERKNTICKRASPLPSNQILNNSDTTSAVRLFVSFIKPFQLIFKFIHRLLAIFWIFLEGFCQYSLQTGREVGSWTGRYQAERLHAYVSRHGVDG